MSDSATPPLATPSPTNPSPDGHTVYTSLVEQDNDLVGLVAYSIYKRDKLSFKEKQRTELGREATHCELVAFARGVCLDGPVAGYRQRATDILQQMYDELVAVQTAEIEKQYESRLKKELKEAHPFWREVLVHFAATVLLVALGGLLALYSLGKNAGVKQTLSDALDLPAAQGQTNVHSATQAASQSASATGTAAPASTRSSRPSSPRPPSTTGSR